MAICWNFKFTSQKSIKKEPIKIYYGPSLTFSFLQTVCSGARDCGKSGAAGTYVGRVHGK